MEDEDQREEEKKIEGKAGGKERKINFFKFLQLHSVLQIVRRCYHVYHLPLLSSDHVSRGNVTDYDYYCLI